MKCGSCKEKGVTIEHVRVCYGQASTGQPATGPRGEIRTTYGPKTPVPAPAGRYAVELEDGRLHFFKLSKPEEGRWAGYTFLSEQASDEYFPVRGMRRDEVLVLIVKNPQEAMLRYGKEIGSCGHCGRTLTNEESRAAGIGPICRGKMGW